MPHDKQLKRLLHHVLIGIALPYKNILISIGCRFWFGDAMV